MEMVSDGGPAPVLDGSAYVRRVRPWLAGVLAWLFPGLGHVYAGNLRAGMLVLVGWIVVGNAAYALLIFWDKAPYNMIAAPASLLAFTCVNIASAVRLAKRTEAGSTKPRGINMAVMLIASIVLSAVAIPVFGEFEAFRVSSGSMEDALFVGDYFLADMDAYDQLDPSMLDVAICGRPGPLPGVRDVKRCIGLPGDTIEFRKTEIYRNGSALLKASTMKSTGSRGESKRDSTGYFVVPADHFFFVGDNLDNSYDSRFYGPISRSSILGKPIRVHWSKTFSRIGLRVQ